MVPEYPETIYLEQRKVSRILNCCNPKDPAQEFAAKKAQVMQTYFYPVRCLHTASGTTDSSILEITVKQTENIVYKVL